MATNQISSSPFPCIMVERPRQRPGRAWIAKCEGDITRHLADSNYGDNWSYERYDSLESLIAVFGDDRADWPDELTDVTADDFPAIMQTGPWGYEFTTPAEDAESELEFALEYIGDDLFALNVLGSREEAADLLNRGGHNVPFDQISAAMVELGWNDCES